VYTQFGQDLGSLGVKPVDKNNLSSYANGDHTGTPENYKQWVTKGARGDGGTNYTGSYSAGADSVACPPAVAPQRTIVDTDIFSSADDGGALATAFALQLNGEAQVLAVGINTRTDRPAVATNSWKCAGALARFYGSGATLGSHMPDNGTDVNAPDFVGPCAATEPAPPAPQTAVSVYRKALAAAPDGSVVFVSTGYLGNLADLLKSPADGTSPLNGHDLVARKVSLLVSMGGRFFTSRPENNLDGDVASAQYVAANWPTKLVWAGYEVGDAIHTGDTLWSTQPTSSPLRAAYDAFVGPKNWYYSYDLVAVYHALRPEDPMLTEVGPGTNVVNDDGSNTFVPGSGNQYYLMFPDQTGVSPGDTAVSATDAPMLSDTLNGLLATLPPGVNPPPPSG
jgi:inosine-uridine nucleoside N-ribohydrolase